MSKRSPKVSRHAENSAGNACVLLAPSEVELAVLRSVFKPVAAIDLRQLVEEANAIGMTPEQIRSRHCQKQIDEILRRLALPGDTASVWKNAFKLLAMTCLGIGQIKYSPKRTNKNARRWSSDDERRLIGMMCRLQEQGLSERQAIDRIAADRTEPQTLPYKGHGTQYSGKTGQARRARALWRQWLRIKRKYPNDLMKVLSPDWPKSPLEQRLRELDHGPLFARSVGDKPKG